MNDMPERRTPNVRCGWGTRIGGKPQGLGEALAAQELQGLHYHLYGPDGRPDRGSTDASCLAYGEHRGLLELAVVHEFCVIDTGNTTKDLEKLTDIISREWLAGSLRDSLTVLGSMLMAQ